MGRDKKIKSPKEVEFQIIEWFDEDIYDEEEDTNLYSVKMLGVSEKGESVCCSVTGFKPYFYIKVPKQWGSSSKKRFIDGLVRDFGRNSKFGEKWVKGYTGISEKDCKISKKKDFFGFKNGETDVFIKLAFYNMSSFYNMRKNLTDYTIDKYKFELYESNLDPVLRFIHDLDIQTAGWVRGIELKRNDISSTQIDVECKLGNLTFIDKKDIAPIVQASYDIECYSSDGSFPCASREDNVIYQIATTFKRYGEDKCFYKNILTLKQCDPIVDPDGIRLDLVCFEEESDLLIAWKNLLVKQDPDIIYQYNGDRFDGKYIADRVEINDIDNEFYNGLGKFKESNSESYIDKKRKGSLKKSKFSSGAYGTTDYDRLIIPGRIHFDVMIYIKRELKLDSYKLDDVALKILKKRKNDVSVKQIFDYYADGSPDKIKIIAEYCLQDTILPQNLVDKLDILPNQLEMAKVTYVPLRYLIERGQQVKIFSQILRKSSKMGYVVPVLKEKECGTFFTIDGKRKKCKERADHGYEVNGEIFEEKCESHKIDGMEHTPKFQGATVLEPLRGAYFEPITTLDFASLYPSIMRAHNMCYSTFVMKPEYDNLEGIEYETIEWETNGKVYCYKYVQNDEISVLPGLLSELYNERKAAKRMMNETTDPFVKSVFNGKQLALKVSMNSVYGFLAANMLKCKPIAASVTARGREMIENTKNYVETNYPGSICIYGDTDSVFIKFKTPAGDKYNELYRNLKNKAVLEPDEECQLKEYKDESMKASFELGKRSSKEITNALFKKPNDLEFEKVYNPLLLFGKKMYIAALYETSPLKADYIDKKGVALKRRDNCYFLKNTYNHIVDLVVEKGERGLEESLEYLESQINRLGNNEIPFDELIIAKTLKSDYKNPNIPHKVLAEKMFERDPGSAPRMNDRVPYIFIEHPNKKAKMYEKIEDPVYAKENNLQPDLNYYIQNQLMNPLCQFYGSMIGEEEIDKFFKKKIKELSKSSPRCQGVYRSGKKRGERCEKDVKFEGSSETKACGTHAKWFKI
jgi:DNA polymerase delta subunit 1